MKNTNANTNATQGIEMKFTKQSFMGIELDILVGHPEHDILFIATQVARAAGLKNPSHASMTIAKGMEGRFVHQLGSLFQAETLKKPKGVQATSWLFTEEATYRMLMSGRSPASEPFRKWVTEVVLPSIRKTGKFDVSEATDEASQQYAGEFAALQDVIRGILCEETSRQYDGEFAALKTLTDNCSVSVLQTLWREAPNYHGALH